MTSIEDARELHRLTEVTLVEAFDKGVIGFAERYMAATLATHVRSGRGLTGDQARQAWRILARDPDALKRAGLILPGARQEPQVITTIPKASGPVTISIRNTGRIHVDGAPFELNEALKLGLHADFHPRDRTWSVAAAPSCAAFLLGMTTGMDVRVSQRVRDLADAHTARIEAVSRLDPGQPLPQLAMEELVLKPLRPYQVRGTDFAASATASLLAFCMGGGKTATAIAAANRLKVQRGIIMCPNKVRGVWPREVAKWSAKSWHIVDGKRPPKNGRGQYQDLPITERVHETERALFDCTCGAQAHFAVWNYEMLSHAPASTWVPSVPLDLVIYDEGQRLKSGTGQVSKRAGEWVNFTKNRVALSGTPMPQHPWDIFGLYRALDPGVFGTNWRAFEHKYIVTKKSRDGRSYPASIVPERQEEFAAAVHSLMYRPVIELKLPGREHLVRTVELEPLAQREYDKLSKELTADLSVFVGHDEDLGEDDTLLPKNMLARMTRLGQFTGGWVPNDEGVYRRVSHAKENLLAEWSSKPKANGTYEITGGLLEEIGCTPGHPGGPEPVIVYAHFRDDLDVIKGIAKKAGLRYGEISGRRSDGLTRESMMNPDIDLLAVQIQSGGTGVDLTRSRYGIWYSKGHSLGDYDQALARQDRHGQTRPVVFIHLVCAGTIDEDKQEALVKRRSIVAVFLAKRGLDPAAFGIADTVIPEPQLIDASGRSGGAVVLPIDDFGGGIMAPREAGQRYGVDGAPVVDKETLRAFNLEDF